MKIRITIFVFVATVFMNHVFAQQTVDINRVENLAGQNLFYAINGEPFAAARFSKVVEGSPYFKDEWMKGTVVLSGGKKIDNLSLKINLLDGTVIYLNNNNEELEASTAIKEVILTDIMSAQNYRFLHSSFTCMKTGKKWFVILDSGKAQLLRQEVRIMKETKPYASATIEQTIHNLPEYYLKTGEQCEKIKSAEELKKRLQELNPSFNYDNPLSGSKKKQEAAMILMVDAFNRS